MDVETVSQDYKSEQLFNALETQIAKYINEDLAHISNTEYEAFNLWNPYNPYNP